MTISGERTEQLDIFCRVTGFTSDFLSFIDVELIRFFHGALQFYPKLFVSWNKSHSTNQAWHRAVTWATSIVEISVTLWSNVRKYSIGVRALTSCMSQCTCVVRHSTLGSAVYYWWLVHVCKHVWSALPQHVTSATSFHVFCNHLKTFISRHC